MSLKKILTLTITIATVSALMVSCNLGSYPGFKKNKSGVYYKIHKDNSEDTTAIRLGSIVTMYLKYGTEDSTMFDSKEMPQPVVIPVLESTYEGDFYEMLAMLKQGDSATFILKAGPLFQQTFQQPEVAADHGLGGNLYRDFFMTGWIPGKKMEPGFILPIRSKEKI